MGVIRNFIEILGIEAEEDLPEKSLGQLVKYDESECIFIPEDKVGIKDIFQIAIDIDIKSKRTINTKDCKTIVIDGIKKLKIIYSPDQNLNQSPDKMVMLNLQLPYNTFVELPMESGDIDIMNLHILDAYFDIIDKRTIYGYLVYLLDIRYVTYSVEPAPKKGSMKVELLSAEQIKKANEPQIALSHEKADKTDDKKYADDLACLYL